VTGLLGARPVASLVVGTGAVAVLDLTTKAAAPLAAPVAPGLVIPLTHDELSLGVATSAALVLVALMTVALLVAAGVAGHLVREGRVGVPGCALILGGALGNLIDRAASGAVHDFLVIGPVVVNLADLAVLAGVLTTGWALAHGVSHGPSVPAAAEGR
jgi:signal peptidase II